MDQNSKPYLKIGDLANRTGKTARTVRYYEELGLLSHPEETPGGFRLFEEQDVSRIETISTLQELGLSLQQIGAIVRNWNDAPTGRAMTETIGRLLTRALEETERKLSHLAELKKQIQTSLEYLDTCRTCDLKPEREKCVCCDAGEHTGEAPRLVGDFLIGPDAWKDRL